MKLLRAIQEGEVEPVGARKTVKVDVRIISATNRNLIDDVKGRALPRRPVLSPARVPIAVPPLREPREDIPDLVGISSPLRRRRGQALRAISGDTLALLTRHRWPGNVRQLENAVFRAVVLSEGDSIGVDEFPQIAAQIGGPVTTVPASEGFTEALHTPAMIEVPPLADFGVAASSPSMHGTLALLDHHGDVRPLEEIEAEVIRFAIAHYRGQMSEVARRLQIGRSTLYRKLENLGLAERAPEGRKDELKEPAEAH